MPKRGDTVYKVWNGKLETARFIEESVLPGCGAPTWEIRGEGDRRSRCSTTMYLDTEKAAWERYLAECREALPDIQKHLEEVKKDLALCESEIVRVEAIIGTPPQ
ncbi:MAG: hypothetical protein ACLQNE_09445 [Thermoguttaceae bacterium]